MLESGFELPSFAKINWFLQIIGRRADGFHELCSVFQTVSLEDRISFLPDEQLTLSCDQAGIPIDGTNLIIQAAEELRKRFNVEYGAKIYLKKKIPSPGGMGGGSSNAAIALLGLSRLWNLKTNRSELAEIGAAIGSDVAFFFEGGTAFGTGRGEVIEPCRDIEEFNLLIVTPPVEVSTAKAFKLLDAPRLTNSDPKSILQICRCEAMALDLRQSKLKNDFEKAVFKVAPEIKRVKEKLFDLGAEHALMSGSGASVFAVFDSRESLETAVRGLKVEKLWKVFSVKTVSRNEYLSSLKMVESLLH